jgi:hypothetical protein
MDKRDIPPPGRHPFDSSMPDLDQLAYALERVQVFFKWIVQHQRSYEKERDTDPQSAESELHNLRDSTEQAVLHLQRLTELLLAGYTIDASKRFPRDFCNETWARWVQLILQERTERLRVT